MKRATASQVMAEIRSDHNLSVKDAWQVYREFRDALGSRKPSLRALSQEASRVEAIVGNVLAPYDEYDEPPEYDYDWEVTAYYEG